LIANVLQVHFREEKNGDYEFHTEECQEQNDYFDHVSSVIVRMKDGQYAMVMALSSNPSDYNGAACWRSKDLASLFDVDTDEAQIR